MFGLGATVDADAGSVGDRRWAIGDTWDVLHDRQAAFELRRLGDGYMVAEGGDLVANTLEGVAVPTSIDNKATCNGIALGLVADEFDVHIFRVLFFVPVFVVDADE